MATKAVNSATLGEVAEAIFTGVALSRRQPSECEPAAVPIINVADLTDGWLPSREDLSQAVFGSGDIRSRYGVHAGDVVLSCRGTVLRVSRVGPESEGVLASANVIVVRPGEGILPAVLFGLLRTPRVQAELRKRVRSSTGQIALTVAEIASLEVSVPPMAIQTNLAALIDAGEAYHAAALRAAELRRAAGYEILEGVLARQAQQRRQ